MTRWRLPPSCRLAAASLTGDAPMRSELAQSAYIGFMHRAIRWTAAGVFCRCFREELLVTGLRHQCVAHVICPIDNNGCGEHAWCLHAQLLDRWC